MFYLASLAFLFSVELLDLFSPGLLLCVLLSCVAFFIEWILDNLNALFSLCLHGLEMFIKYNQLHLKSKDGSRLNESSISVLLYAIQWFEGSPYYIFVTLIATYSFFGLKPSV